jgi:hypothetical protein
MSLNSAPTTDLDPTLGPHCAGQPVPSDCFARLHEVDDWTSCAEELPALLARDGYLLLRGALPVDKVMAARRDVLTRLAGVGEVAQPIDDAVATGSSRRLAMHPDLGAFWRGVCESPTLRAATHGPAMAALTAAALGSPSLPFDFLWLRTMLAGRATPLHFDHVYMNRGSSQVITAWVPLGDVPLVAGPLVVVENSHRFDDLIERYRGVDVDRDALPGSFPQAAVAFARERETRLLSTDFRAGDVLLFSMFTLHGSLDNCMSGSRLRLSCDVRWQPATDGRDDRWFGSPPAGHVGTSYGGLNGARPLGEAYRAR